MQTYEFSSENIQFYLKNRKSIRKIQHQQLLYSLYIESYMLVVRKGKGQDVVAQRAAIMSARLLPSLHIRQKHIQIQFQ